MRNILCIIIAGVMLQNCAALAASASKAVKRGNKLYKREKFSEAVKEYEKAREISPDSDIVNFDLGAARYKNEDYQTALDLFTKSLITENTALEAKASYNIGNSKYKQAELIEGGNLEGAISLLKESLGYYERAAELEDKDEDAKANYEFVKKKIELLEEKLKTRPQQKQRQKQQEEKKEGERRAERQEAQVQQAREEEQEGKPEADKGKEAGEQEKEKEAAGEETEQMSKEQALLLLEGYRQEEESAQREVEAQEQAPYPGVLKDW